MHTQPHFSVDLFCAFYSRIQLQILQGFVEFDVSGTGISGLEEFPGSLLEMGRFLLLAPIV
jgi:hypothetical protein